MPWSSAVDCSAKGAVRCVSRLVCTSSPPLQTRSWHTSPSNPPRHSQYRARNASDHRIASVKGRHGPPQQMLRCAVSCHHFFGGKNRKINWNLNPTLPGPGLTPNDIKIWPARMRCRCCRWDPGPSMCAGTGPFQAMLKKAGVAMEKGRLASRFNEVVARAPSWRAQRSEWAE